MRTHPIFLRLEGRRCVVLGGDAESERRATACRDAGGQVTLIGLEARVALAGPAESGPGRMDVVQRPYRAGDLSGAFLAYAATRDPALIGTLREEAEREHVLLNVVDRPDDCTFFAPAALHRGDLCVAVGTGGASPGLAARVRNQLADVLGPEYGPYVAILQAVRGHLAGRPDRATVMAGLLDSGLLDLVRRGAVAEIDGLLGALVGGRCTLAGLGMEAAL
jgi:siroheme synthase-like protein